jgi:hypothetical protein
MTQWHARYGDSGDDLRKEILKLEDKDANGKGASALGQIRSRSRQHDHRVTRPHLRGVRPSRNVDPSATVAISGECM